MTNQEAFDAMVKHLKTMSGQCFDDKAGQCTYLRADGNRWRDR